MTYDPGPTLHKNPCAPGLTTDTQPSPSHAGHKALTGRTVHNDLSALLELLDTIVGLAHVGTQVTLADVVDGEDAGELCVSLLGAPLWYPLTPLCLPRTRGSTGSEEVGSDRADPQRHTPQPKQQQLQLPWTQTLAFPWDRKTSLSDRGSWDRGKYMWARPG